MYRSHFSRGVYRRTYVMKVVVERQMKCAARWCWLDAAPKQLGFHYSRSQPFFSTSRSFESRWKRRFCEAPASRRPEPPLFIAKASSITHFLGRFLLQTAVLILIFLITYVIVEAIPERRKRKVLSSILPAALRFITTTANYILVERVLLHAVAYLCEEVDLAVSIADDDGLQLILSHTSRHDLYLNASIAHILACMAAIDHLRPKLMQLEVAQVLASIISVLVQDETPFTEKLKTRVNNDLAVAIAGLSVDPPNLEVILETLGFDTLSRIFEPSLPLLCCIQVSETLADLSQSKAIASRMIRLGLLSFFEEMLVNNLDTAVGQQMARCVANCAMDDELSFRIGKEGGFRLLEQAIQYELRSLGLDKHILRSIANLARSDQNQKQLLNPVFVRFLAGWLTRLGVPEDLLFVALAAAANLAVSPSAAEVLLEVAPFRRVAAACSSHPSVTAQLSRLIANLSACDSCRAVLFEELSTNEALNQRLRQSDDAVTIRSLARALANFSLDSNAAQRICQSQNIWKWLMNVTRTTTDVNVKREIVRAIANIAINAPAEVRSKEGVQALLREWASTSDLYLKSNAVRAEASLASVELREMGRFDEGIYLLWPPPENVSQQPVKFDVVFVHGVEGDAFTTWSYGNPPQGCWPKEWLPQHLSGARILSVGYDSFLSRWRGTTVSLDEQAQILQRKLKLAGVGVRPAVFVTHSFGGLLVKQILVNAAKQQEYSDMLRNTCGVVFYSVPHFGSELSRLTEYRVVDLLYRGSPIIGEMRPNAVKLKTLNDEFQQLAPHIQTLSFGENDQTCYLNECWQVVGDLSANPNFKGPGHSFVKLDYNHQQVCKPLQQNDQRYYLVAKFLQDALQHCGHPR